MLNHEEDSDPADFMRLLDVARRCNADMLDQNVLHIISGDTDVAVLGFVHFRTRVRCPNPESDRFVAAVLALGSQADMEKRQDPLALSIRSLLLELGDWPLTSRAEAQRMATELLQSSQYEQSQPGLAGISHDAMRMLAKIELQIQAQVPRRRGSGAYVRDDSGGQESPRTIRGKLVSGEITSAHWEVGGCRPNETQCMCERTRKYLEDISEYTA